MSAQKATITLKVLLIEDSEAAAEKVSEMLDDAKSVRFELDRVDRLDAGLKRLDHRQYDAVLLDLGLPDSSGLDTFLKLQYHSVSTPVVVITSLEDEEAAIETMRSGAQDYLIKGKVDADILARSLRYAIEHKRSERELIWDHERLKTRIEQLTAEIEQLTAENLRLTQALADRK